MFKESFIHPKVFLDTTVLKFAVDRLDQLQPTPTTITWGDKEFTIDVHEPVLLLPNEKLSQPSRDETNLLPKIADMASNSQIELLAHKEVFFEFLGLPKTRDERGLFYGAPITWVDAPIQYSRILCSAFGNSKRYQVEFLKSISNPRFHELQRVCGAYQGKDKHPNLNQMVDAFHIWCAESAGAHYFLTCDFKLINQVKCCKNNPPLPVVLKPSGLVKIMKEQGIKGRETEGPRP